MRRTRTELLLITIAITLMVICVFLPYILSNSPFEYGGDLKPQGYPFFTEFKNVLSFKNILKGIFPFYSWNLFLGTNFWASKAFYMMGDFFSYISLLVPAHFYTVYGLVSGLKIIISGLSFFLLLDAYNRNFPAKFIGSISFAFSAWLIFFFGNGSFISFYALVPLYFLGIEKYFKDNSKILFLGMTAILLFTNFYFFYTLSAFTPIYFIYRFIVLKKSLKDFLPLMIKLIGVYLVGVLITSILTIPTLLYMLGNDRVGDTPSSLLFGSVEIYMHLLSGVFVPSHIFIYNNNVFETGYHISREITLWAGSITALLLPQLLTDKDKTFKFATIVLYSFFGLILISPLGNSLMHGLSEYSFRWTFLIIIMNILISSRYLSDFSLINRNTLLLTIVFIVAIIILAIPITLLMSDKFAIWLTEYRLQSTIFLIAIVSFILFYLLLIYRNKTTYIFLIALSVLELTGCAFYNLSVFRKEPLSSWEEINNASSVLQDNANELNDYLDGLNPINQTEFYRVYVPLDSLYWSYSHNQNLQYQIKGLMTYDSTYSPSMNDLKHIAPQIMDYGSSWIFNIKDPQLIDFLNTKYAIVTNVSELPHQDFSLITNTFRGSLSIYENENYRSLGTTYNSIMDYQTFKDKEENNLELLSTTVIAQSEEIMKIEPYLGNDKGSILEHIEYYDNTLTGDITTKDQTFMVMTIPYDSGWKILVNDETVDSYSVNGGFIGIPLEAGHNSIELYFIPSGFKLGFILSGIAFLLSIFVFGFELRSRIKVK